MNNFFKFIYYNYYLDLLLSETHEECEVLLKGGEEVVAETEPKKMKMNESADFMVERTPDKSADSDCFPLVSFFLFKVPFFSIITHVASASRNFWHLSAKIYIQGCFF